jgi:hypothetical protein
MQLKVTLSATTRSLPRGTPTCSISSLVLLKERSSSLSKSVFPPSIHTSFETIGQPPDKTPSGLFLLFFHLFNLPPSSHPMVAHLDREATTLTRFAYPPSPAPKSCSATLYLNSLR